MGEKQRLKLEIFGAVQGIGFRPFVYRLANDLALSGWVNNSARGVTVEVEGESDQLQAFWHGIEQDKPRLSVIQRIEAEWCPPVGYENFAIHASDANGAKAAFVLPDIATCPDCLREIFDARNRRHAYAFTNCTNCGPRYTIIEALPYDRPLTTMKHFAMCPACQAEYETPEDRRFHAQPNACPVCGPHLELWDADGTVLCTHDAAIESAAEVLRAGQIVAVKGIGGFHLMVDARNLQAIKTLRSRKCREEKPLAVMMPSLQLAKTYCEVSALEEQLLTSPEAPIVLLRRKAEPHEIAANVAPGNPYLGVMLPYAPLHHLLLSELGFPVVATSGNLTDEPICTDEHEALKRLSGLADCFLVHNRPILRHVDDSVVCVVGGREMILRRARGYAPLPIKVSMGSDLPPVLAAGAQQKNTIAIARESDVFVSQHIGDLETAQAYTAFRHTVDDFQQLFDFYPEAVACDMHPDYLSTQYAHALSLPRIPVQHHYAHVLSCIADNAVAPPVLGVAWDGTGWGPDGTIWGGEFLYVDEQGYERVSHLRPFRLPGGEQAVKEPRRSALGLLYELYGDDLFTNPLPLLANFSRQELRVLHSMLRQGLNSPQTSSAGRLFDAVAALLGLRNVASFEGQAAMLLEFAADWAHCDTFYDFNVDADGVIDWQPMIEKILLDILMGVTTPVIAARFHNTLAEMIVAIARRTGEQQVALTGGCFQNRYLTERTIQRLREAGFTPLWHRRIPPNDGGIAVGQVLAAARQLQEKKTCV